MSYVDDCLKKLVSAVLNSEEYTKYQEIRGKIKLEPEKERSIHNFRRRNYLLQRSKDNMDLFEEIDHLEQEFARFRQEPLVDEYLAAELAVCRLIQNINITLMEQMDFDLGFVDQ